MAALGATILAMVIKNTESLDSVLKSIKAVSLDYEVDPFCMVKSVSNMQNGVL